MNTTNRLSTHSISSDLERVIEPLASYICATEQPRSALKSALAALLREVEATNSAAVTHFRGLLAN
jgi:hypothetical protein